MAVKGLCAGFPLAALALAAPPAAAAPTFNRDIAPIVWNRCAGCHRPGEAGPFPLLSYGDVAKRAKSIQAVVRSGYMPPWPPAAGHGEFAGDRSLTPAQRRTLLAWLAGDLLAGDPADLPPQPVWTAGWRLGPPDLVVAMPEAFPVPADGPDIFHNFVIPIPVAKRRFVRGFEFRPGNARLTHHARMLLDRSGRSRAQDALTDGAGFAGGMALDAVFDPEGHWIGWTPGKQPVLRSPDMAWTLEPGTDLVIELHMVPTGKPETIRAALGLYFTDRAPSRKPFILRLGKNTIDIPAGDENYRTEDSFVLPVDVEVLNVYAHAHYLGKSVAAWAELPGGARQPLLRIDDWSFDWQDEYRYKQPVFLPKGSVLFTRFHYDNSADNPRNPSRPPERVIYGWKTSQEMGDLWLQALPATAADRAILAEKFQTKEVAAQIAGLRKQLEVAPGDLPRRIDLGYRYLQSGQVDRAVEHFQIAAAESPSSVFILHNLGVAWNLKGDLENAVACYRKAIRADPGHGPSYNNLAVALANKGEVDEAERQLRNAIGVDPRYADAYGNLGAVLVSLRRFDEAAAIYEKALEIDPGLGAVHYNLAGLYKAAGDAEAARRHYRAAAAGSYPQAAALAKKALAEF